MSVMTLSALTISVTESDLLLGRRNTPTCCPIARALARKGYRSVNVWGTYLSFLDPKSDTCQFIDFTQEMRDFVKDFDRDRSGKPTVFTLPLE